MTLIAEQLSLMIPVAGLTPISKHRCNFLLEKWQHNLGPIDRPFGVDYWALEVESEAVAVAVTASTVSDHVAGKDMTRPCPACEGTGLKPPRDGDGCPECQGSGKGEPIRLEREEIVELARLCADPVHRHWATQPMLRLWRQVAAPRWSHWPVTAAVSYSQNARHGGNIYRWDGWTCIKTTAASSGGAGNGSWSKPVRKGDQSYGQKSLWLWRYAADGDQP